MKSFYQGCFLGMVPFLMMCVVIGCQPKEASDTDASNPFVDVELGTLTGTGTEVGLDLGPCADDPFIPIPVSDEKRVVLLLPTNDSQSTSYHQGLSLVLEADMADTPPRVALEWVPSHAEVGQERAEGGQAQSEVTQKYFGNPAVIQNDPQQDCYGQVLQARTAGIYDDPNVLAVIVGSSDTTLETLLGPTEHDQLIISLSGTSPQLANFPNLLRMVPFYEHQAASIHRQLQRQSQQSTSQNPKNTAVLAESSLDNNGLARQLSEINVTTMTEQSHLRPPTLLASLLLHPSGLTTTQLLPLLQSQLFVTPQTLDAAVFFGSADTWKSLFDDETDLPPQSTSWWLGHHAFSDDLLELSQIADYEIFAMSLGTHDVSHLLSSRYEQDYEEQYQVETDAFSDHGYDAGVFVTTLLETCQEAETLSRDCMLSAAKELQYSGITGLKAMDHHAIPEVPQFQLTEESFTLLNQDAQIQSLITPEIRALQGKSFSSFNELVLELQHHSSFSNEQLSQFQIRLQETPGRGWFSIWKRQSFNNQSPQWHHQGTTKDL